MAITTFKADVHHVAGLNVTATSTHHTITVDEPELLGGTDKGPNPVELLLDALGSCQAIAINAFAPKFKVKIKKLDIHVEGDIDLGGFLGTNSARPGYQRLRSTIDLDADGDPDAVNRLIEYVEAHCPVGGTLANGVAITVNRK